MSDRIANPSREKFKHDRLMLSEREKQVLESNKKNKELADELNITESTVSTYKRRKNGKLDNQKEAILEMLHNQRQDGRTNDLEQIARESVERLKDLGIDAEITINE